MTKTELITRNREICDRMSEMSGREMNEEERNEFATLEREFNNNTRRITLLSQTEQEATSARERDNANAVLREYLRGVHNGTARREVTLNTQIKDSGAIALTIHNLIPTLEEGLGLPSNLSIVTGVVGDQLYPYNVESFDLEEVGETAELNSGKIEFDNLKPVSHRVGGSVDISNSAIDEAAFDLLGLVQRNFTLATKKYIAQKIYSQAAWAGNKGPFSGLTKKGDIDLSNDAYKAILAAVAEFADKGFDTSKICLVMDATTEASLKATPKAQGQGGFIIENGRCAGYEYVVSHYINTTLNGEGKLVPTADKFIGFGLFDYLATQQHGNVRLVTDIYSKSKRNLTVITLNTEWSFTDLSVKINKKGGTATQAFALYKIVTA